MKLDNRLEEAKEEMKIKSLQDVDDDKMKHMNGNQVANVTTPPKPLPRASRANSLSEDEPKPVARPRTSPSSGSVVTSVNPNTITGYKVRFDGIALAFLCFQVSMVVR